MARPRFRTPEQFEAWYVQNAGWTMEQWRKYAAGDRYPKRCDCGDKLCTGWQMAHRCDDDRSLRHLDTIMKQTSDKRSDTQ